MKIIDKSVLKLLISPRVSEEYGVLQLSYETTRHFNSASQVAIQCMLFDWAHVQGSAVVRREQHEYDVKKKHQEPQSCLDKRHIQNPARHLWWSVLRK